MRFSFNKAAVLVLLIFVLSVFDACFGFIQPRNMFKALPGDTIPVAGRLGSQPEDLERYTTMYKQGRPMADLLRYEVSDPGLVLEFEGMEEGRVWHGNLAVPESLPAGTYELRVWQADIPRPDVLEHQTIQVFSSMSAKRATANSFMTRFLGIDPFWVVLSSLPLAALFLVLAFRRASREEALLRARGLGSIFRLRIKKGVKEFYFGLGSNHGVDVGDTLVLLNRSNEPVGEVTAEEVGPDWTRAMAGPELPVKAGYLVMRKNGPADTGDIS